MSEFQGLKDQLMVIMAETGEVISYVGGVEIRVLDPVIFPWHKVFTILFDLPHDVWMVREDGTFTIKSKPPPV
ncbi:hypothetical protein AC482_03560 [miscellaneous Crenarchaeota group-15 archaeon DG-45]|uniref:Uncharacterized protein n=1 Tax=miscellaneous Crenarchaeota group-15 archaeon DG-45 TaxID=1685127 RepID=A0A0M0BPR1_9ARCH|nr:MAG: hypothetical protein AC482_03560 [miscellaneous Crenarchaeota group-15 archaeon DG-45]